MAGGDSAQGPSLYFPIPPTQTLSVSSSTSTRSQSVSLPRFPYPASPTSPLATVTPTLLPHQCTRHTSAHTTPVHTPHQGPHRAGARTMGGREEETTCTVSGQEWAGAKGPFLFL